MKKINNFVKIDSERGPFIVNRHCSFQAEHMIKTGQTHIEPELKNILGIVQLLPDNSVVIDAGANVGLVAVPIAQMIAPKKGIVYAFEAQRMMAYALCGAVALNDLENVFVHNKALGSSNETLKMDMPNYSKPQDFGMFTLLNQPEQSIENIESVSIDSLNLSRLDFLKIDVEGMEIDVLKGCHNSLQKYEPWCWIEYWKVDIDDIKQQFEGLDYAFYIMDALNLLCVPLKRMQGVDLTINAKRV